MIYIRPWIGKNQREESRNGLVYVMLKVSQYVTLTDQRKCHPFTLQSVSH